MKNRYRLTFEDGQVIDVEHADMEKAIKKAKRFYNREDDPKVDVTHVQYSKNSKMMTFAEMDAWEAEMRKKRADIAAGIY